MENIEIDVRYSAPSKFDSAPHTTIAKVVTGLGKDNETYKYYIQASKNDQQPEWMRMGDFLEIALESLFTRQTFVDETSLMYQLEQIKKKSVFKRN